MWDTKKGDLTNVKGSTQFWLGPFRVGIKLVNDAYYLYTLEGRRFPLPFSRKLSNPIKGKRLDFIGKYISR
jgi:hypothetical protein